MRSPELLCHRGCEVDDDLRILRMARLIRGERGDIDRDVREEDFLGEIAPILEGVDLSGYRQALRSPWAIECLIGGIRGPEHLGQGRVCRSPIIVPDVLPPGCGPDEQEEEKG
jgi:hypothetical protein